MNAFLQAILSEPESDAPRLVYADHLVERGDPRGELISLQIATSRGRGNAAAETRIAELIDSCWDDLAAVPLAAGVQRFCVRRGFVEAIRLEERQVHDLGAILAGAPITELELAGARDAALRLAKMRELLNIRTLSLRGLGLGDRRSIEILRSGFLANVRTLDLSGNGLGASTATALVRGFRHLPCLEELDLTANRLGEVGVLEIARSPLLEQLVRLSVDEEDVPEELERLLEQRSGSPIEHGVWFPRDATR